MKTLRALLCLLTFRHKWQVIRNHWIYILIQWRIGSIVCFIKRRHIWSDDNTVWSRERGHRSQCSRCNLLSPFVNLHDEDEFDRVHGRC